MNQGLLFIGLGGSTQWRLSLKSRRTGAGEICPFIFIGSEGGKKAPIANGTQAAAKGVLVLDFWGLAFLLCGGTSPKLVYYFKNIWR